MRSLVISIVFVCAFISNAHACPLISDIPDFNCDGKIVVTVLGDSLVYGFGDTRNGNQGGYVLRAQKKLKDITIHNLGIQGLKTGGLSAIVVAAFKGKKKFKDFKTDLLESDYVVLDLGRNDRWDFGEPSATQKRLKEIRASIRKQVAKADGTPPLVITAVLMLPNRGSQGPWVKVLDKLILDSDTTSAPADLRFDLVSKRLLSDDQIHPTPKGYDALSRQFTRYLTQILPDHALALRPDLDSDGIFDAFESSLFGTDPTKTDTDGDGKSDGYEVFTSETDPLNPSS